jgi:hypothetical protein
VALRPLDAGLEDAGDGPSQPQFPPLRHPDGGARR